MIIEKGVVTRVDGKSVWVQTQQSSACGGCATRQGCGQKLLHKYLGRTSALEAQLLEDSTLELSEGDSVEIGLSEKAVLAGSLVTYGLPIVCLILAILLADVLLPQWSVLLAVLGIGCGFVLSRHVLRRFFSPYQFIPIVLDRHQPVSVRVTSP